MSQQQSQRHCKMCERTTLYARDRFPGTWGCLLTILTGGLFLPIWLAADIFSLFNPWRCQTCGNTTGGGGTVLSLVFVVSVGVFGYVMYGQYMEPDPTPPEKQAEQAAQENATSAREQDRLRTIELFCDRCDGMFNVTEVQWEALAAKRRQAAKAHKPQGPVLCRDCDPNEN